MRTYKIVIGSLMATLAGYAQNDQDAIRYSRTGANGTSRFAAMGGAFGAVGADVSCAAYNPAGLALFRKGEVSYSGGIKTNNISSNIHKNTTSDTKSYLNFNSFGLVATWLPQDKENRNVFGITVTQPVNFSSTTRMSGYTNNSSVAKDMMNLVKQKDNLFNLNSSYEGLAFDTYLIDTVDGQYFTYVDTKRSVLQRRDVTTSGKVNDINISLGHSNKDKFYIGASLGLPQIRYESTTEHTEADDKDSMRVILTSPNTYTTTYVDGLPAIDREWLGFNKMSYTEYFKTTGHGFNLKIGAIARVNDIVRLGFYYHTPTFYNLTDNYQNSMSVTFDNDIPNPVQKNYPENSGYYSYQLITPSRLGLNAAFIVKKLAVIGIDYETVNYSRAQLQSENSGDFDDANTVIKKNYKQGHNVRIGAELNTKPLMYRIGYSMQGSPFGDAFTGDYVRNTFSAGIGFRTASDFYFDFAILRTIATEPYYLFQTLNTRAMVKINSTSLSATVGYKF